MMVAASDPGHAEAAKGMSDAVEAARKAGLSEEEIDKVSTEATEVFGELLETLGQLGSITIEGVTFVATGKPLPRRFQA